MRCWSCSPRAAGTQLWQEHKHPRVTAISVRRSSQELWSDVAANVIFIDGREKKKNPLYLKMRGKSGGAGDKAKLQLWQAEFVWKGVCDPEVKKNKEPFFL